jgi:CRP-like cAMP-binding protein
MTSAVHLQNGFLKSLSVSDLAAIEPHLQTVELSDQTTLVGLGRKVTHVYFPNTAVISLVLQFKAGDWVEVAMVGHDSVLGAFGTLGEPVALVNAIVLLPGSASIIEVDRLRAAAEQSSTMRGALVRHEQAISAQVQQFAGCNAANEVESRLARWLLQLRDLSGSDQFKITQEMMASRIGARRNSVSLVANALQELNVIRYSRGHFSIVDGDRLNRTACECYAAVKAQYERLGFPA